MKEDLDNVMEPLPMVRVLLLHTINKNPKVSGYSIINLINEFTASRVELRTGTVYNELRKLEKNGLLESTQQTTSRKVRLYTISNPGLEELKRLINIIKIKIDILLQPLIDLN